MELLELKVVYLLDNKNAGRIMNLQEMHSLLRSGKKRFLLASYQEVTGGGWAIEVRHSHQRTVQQSKRVLCATPTSVC